MSDQPEKSASTAIVVIIEWNGKKPSSTFYNRLHAYGLYSRQPSSNSEEFSLLEWRANRQGSNKRESKRGLILQEGLIVVNSLTLAEDIARWAKNENKAALVQIGHMTVSDFTMTERDFQVFDKLQQAVSKRGPKVVGDAGSYAVTCFDDVKTYSIQAESLPVMCPTCGGSNVQSRMGQLHIYQQYDERHDDKYLYWMGTRFGEGSFEVPVLKANEVGTFYPTPKSAKVNLSTMDLSDEFYTSQSAPDDYFHLMDVAYCVSTMQPMHRLEKRLMVIDAYVRSGGEHFMTFNAPTKGIDLLDLCTLENAYTAYL